MRIRDLPGWPPVWARTTGADRVLVGEVGKLIHVQMDPSHTKILITIESEGRPSTGVLEVRRDLHDRCGAVLRAHQGRPIKAVSGATILDG